MSNQPLGSAAQEAARLLESLTSWLGDRGVSAPPIATGSRECRACPICLALAALRDHHPEVVDQLGRAAEALVAAVRAAVVEHEDQWARATRPDVEHIDID